MMINGQIILNTLIAAAFGYLMAMAIAPTYRLFRYFDLSLAGISLIAAYTTSYCIKTFDMPVTISVVLAIVFAIFIHILIKFIVPILLMPKADSSALLLISLGIYICIVGVLSVFFGTELVSPPYQQAGNIIQLSFGRITSVQAISIAVAIAVPLIFGIFMNTRIGMAIRATSSDAELADVAGIRVGCIAMFTGILSAFFAGLFGVLLALDVGIRPTLGLQPILLGVVAVVIGMSGGAVGIFFSVLIIAFLQNLATANLGPHWQDAIVFVILILFLLFKPEGFFGKKIRSAAV